MQRTSRSPSYSSGVDRVVVSALLALSFITLFAQGQRSDALAPVPPFEDPVLHGYMLRILDHMDGFNADSSMHWIAKAMLHIEPETDNEALYYLLSYRAEVLYYEGLFNEAMKDLDRCMPIAIEMKDSLLIANVHNLKALLHENIQDSKEALPHMRAALAWFPASPKARYPVTELHHIHGNLGSYLMQQGLLDSAGFHLVRSLQLARSSQAGRARAVAHWSLGGLALRESMPDSAVACYARCITVARDARDFDIMLDGYAGLAEAHAAQGQKVVARQNLAQGAAHLLAYPDAIGLVTRRNFARRSSAVYRMLGDADQALIAISAWHHMDSAITKRNVASALTTQAELLRSDRDLTLERIERDRVAMDLLQVRRTRTIILVAGGLVLLALSGLILAIASRRRKEQQLAGSEVKRMQQEAVIAELRLREELGRDMHDDLGAGLSALKLKSEMALRKTTDTEQRGLLSALAATSGELIGSMRQIIWAMNDDQGSLEDLVVYCGNYVRTYLDEHGLQARVTAAPEWPTLQLTSAQRRNFFLVVKEALHNIVKHAHAASVEVELDFDAGLRISIRDNGTGLPRNASLGVGNGIRNMTKRMEMVQGSLRIEPGAGGLGTEVVAFMPLPPNKGSIAASRYRSSSLAG